MNDRIASAPRRHLGRSVGAVLAGLIVIFAVTTATDMTLRASGVFPAPGQPMSAALWLLATVYRIVIAVAGCYLTARLAPGRPMAHAMALGTIGLALSLAGTIATWNRGPGFGPRWYPLALVATALSCAWAGGALRERQVGAGLTGTPASGA